MLERLLRKFSYEEIEALIPDEDKKLILAIKKRREAFKRKKNASNVENEAPAEEKPKFEEAIQDSGSDLESDDDNYIPEQFAHEKAQKVLSF